MNAQFLQALDCSTLVFPNFRLQRALTASINLFFGFNYSRHLILLGTCSTFVLSLTEFPELTGYKRSADYWAITHQWA